MNSKWAKDYDQCTECGTSEIAHLGRGLCRKCYNKNIESRHKDNNRERAYGLSSSILTKEYLLEQYVKNNKSLGDIAKESNCSRQYVFKRMNFYGISKRDKSASRSLALSQEKITWKLHDENGNNYSVTLKKLNVNENFFSSWSAEMAYVLGIIYTDGNLNPGRIREPWRSKTTSTIPMFSIAQKQREILDKVLSLMDCDAKLYFHKERIYGEIKAGAIYTFQIPNETLMTVSRHKGG